ncbi:NADH-cytochrome b5 reductase-like [Branchiostoma belcheri]|nr:NADH-cytochrome b5 reductase-like [Branchiostoma belcheri]
MENSDPPPTATQTASPSNCHVTAEAGCDWLAALERSHVTAEAGCDWPAATEQSHVTAEAGCDWPAATEQSHVTAEAGCDWPAAPDPPLPSDCCGGGCDPPTPPCPVTAAEEGVTHRTPPCPVTAAEGGVTRVFMISMTRSCGCGRRSAELAGKGNQLHGKATIVGRWVTSSKICFLATLTLKDNYTTFKLENIQQLTFDMTSETNVYRFQIPGNGHLGLTTGQHLILRGSVSGRSVTRQYTPISPLEAKGYFEVLIKVYAAGEMSRYVRTWQVGDLVEWRGPFGTFTYRPNQYRQVVMVAAGTGVTPMLQVAGRILGNELDETRVRLLYACRRYRDILLKNSLDEMAAFWNFSASYWLSQENPKNFQPKYGDEIHHGRLDRVVLSAELPPPGSSVLVLICGTRSFNSDMEVNLQALGFSQMDFFRF